MNHMSKKHLAGALSCAALLATACAPDAQEGTPQQRQQAQAPTEQQVTPMQGSMTAAQVEQITRDWPEASRQAIQYLIDKYGAPAAVGAGMAVWGETGPWKRTVVYNEAVPHHFPMQHVDVMQQWINYQAPVDQYDELARYDGSVVLERTIGEMSARCDKEPANFLAVNLAHEVATGKRTVEDARMEYGKQVKALMAGEKSDYTSGIMFTPPSADAARDADEALAMMKDM